MMIESCMKLHGDWMQKRTLGPAIVAFVKGWASLEAFLDGDPKVALRCDFMWELFLKVLAHDVQNADSCMALHLRKTVLEKRFECDHCSLEKLQNKYFVLYLSMAMELALPTAEVMDVLARVTHAFLSPTLALEFPKALLQEITDFACLVPSNAQIPAADELQRVIDKVPPALSSDAFEDAPVLMSLRRHHKHGSVILSAAQERLRIARASDSFIADVKARHTTLDELLRLDKATPELATLESIDNWYFALSDVNRKELDDNGAGLGDMTKTKLNSGYVRLLIECVCMWVNDFSLSDGSLNEFMASDAFTDHPQMAQRVLRLQGVVQADIDADTPLKSCVLALRGIVQGLENWYKLAPTMLRVIENDLGMDNESMASTLALGGVFSDLQLFPALAEAAEVSCVALDWAPVEHWWSIKQLAGRMKSSLSTAHDGLRTGVEAARKSALDFVAAVTSEDADSRAQQVSLCTYKCNILHATTAVG